MTETDLPVDGVLAIYFKQNRVNAVNRKPDRHSVYTVAFVPHVGFWRQTIELFVEGDDKVFAVLPSSSKFVVADYGERAFGAVLVGLD